VSFQKRFDVNPKNQKGGSQVRKQEDIRNVSKEILADDKELILHKKFIRYKDEKLSPQ